ncbi:hypothetical protein phytr_6280 [Candidatus Phycorickettsia trachydisci]|uniref:Uncharacterized protein n=1 Tax=Candidatus Phycorickettsia trachydisci TaxID=2115978 RepID=A0A2P1P8G9_9RICK|nr:DUF2706 domain-containing protein [Candidatus Phycorickettsia trachydisci]AVP87569.1 hypothetical protein phytr_6280 [Candidatus Phycorickettsia trachydisci]
MKKIFLIVFAFNMMSACVQKAQYEVLSPCVSKEIQSPWLKNPCVRKMLNHDIA